MRTIYKFPIPVQDRVSLQIHADATIRHVAVTSPRRVCIWAEVDLDRPILSKEILIVGTGHPIPDDAGDFLGTVIDPPFVWHLCSVRDEDPFASPEYQKFVEEQAKHCTCTPASNRPCDGLLAGGLCDDLHFDGDDW